MDLFLPLPSRIEGFVPRLHSSDAGLTELAAPAPVEESEHGNDLEDEQSPVEEKRRSIAQGDDAGLTELAAPAPVEESEHGDDLENEESQAGKDADRSMSGDEGDEGLTEMAVPVPLAHSDSHSHSHSNDHEQDEEEAVEKGSPGVPQKEASRWDELSTISWLIFFSFWGTLARMGVETITTYPYASVTSTVLWANLGGSLIIGFLIEDRRFFRASVGPLDKAEKDELNDHIDQRKKTLPLYIGLATGFCGSFTSFSTYITDAFLALSNDLATASPTSPYHTIAPAEILLRNGGFSFEAAIAILILHPMVAICGLKTGAHIAVGLEKVMPSLPSRFIQRYLDVLIVPIAFGCWLGAVLLTIWPPASDWRRRATMALIFSPLGCLLRFYASKHLNSRIPSFPLGTFAVNVFGTCIEGMCYNLQHTTSIIASVSNGDANPCAVLEGVMQGFCGCATTVSTWVAELNGLRRRNAWFYGLMTVSVALGLQVAIMGSVAWTSGFNARCGYRA
ncbi:hypothetical protein LTS08_008781 [Lithohypha guttulata]|uniref:Uncharacterized protein n=1 Tax=Lithohypha guttulata TaxID=1690604 RepID=A0ABR0JUY7_9EURO|nr:hypothetical protein LTR24_010106 [Lithohypha guttulata]KAK5093977.1 hypothetical protein LTS08_008781 [Lithohypha guttulata]KAK5309597.1 hypothetical protein LTR70_010149 [Exophiala xenobiotica]